MSSRRAKAVDANMDGPARPTATPNPTRAKVPDQRRHAAPDGAAHDLPGRAVPARPVGGTLCRLGDRAARGPGDRAETAVAAAGPPERPARRAARTERHVGDPAAHSVACRAGERRCRTRRVLGQQTAGGTAADPEPARVPRQTDRHGRMDDGPVAEPHRRGGGATRGTVRAPVHCDGRAVQRHRQRGGRPVHHAVGAVLPAGVGRDLPAPFRRDFAELQGEAAGGGNHIGYRAERLRLSDHGDADQLRRRCARCW